MNVSRWLGYLGALTVGVVFVLAVFPADLLTSGVVPDDRLLGDVAEHVVGQRAFLMDGWHWPLLRTTMLDWPRGLSIAMTDSNPLVSLPLKTVAFWLPAGFSTILPWLAFCYVAQPVAAVFALRSAGETRLVPAVAIALFAASMPTLLFRHAHSALSGHFLILMALGAYFRTTAGRRGGVALPLLLLPASMLVHPYLAVMVLAVLLAAPTTLLLRRDRRWRAAAATVLASLAITLGLAAGLGYGAVNPPGGFGNASMNLASPFQPVFSYFLGDGVWFADGTGQQSEGYQYLGLGLLILLALAVVLRPRLAVVRNHAGIVLAALALTALAVSNAVYLEHHRLGTLRHMPAFLNQLRSSGRLFWPVAYLLLVAGVVAVARLRPRPVAYAALLATALLQVADAQNLRRDLSRDLVATTPAVVDPATLERLLASHQRVTMLPTYGCGSDEKVPGFMQILLAASRRRVAVNTMYVARFERLPECADTATARRPLAPGELRVFLPLAARAGPLLVPDGECRALATLSVCTLDAAALAGLPPVAMPAVPLGQRIEEGDKLPVPELGPGWYRPQSDGVWSLEHAPVLALRIDPLTGAVEFTALVHGFTGDPRTAQHVTLSVNGHEVGRWDLPDRVPTTIRASIPADDLVAGPQVLRFDVARPARPIDHGATDDFRELGLFLHWFRVDPA